MICSNRNKCKVFNTSGRDWQQLFSRRAPSLFVAFAVAVAASVAALAAPPLPAADRVSKVAAEVESQLPALEVSVERASYSAAQAPYRLLVETRIAVSRLAEARRQLIGQPWHIAMPLLHRLDLAERRARTVLAKLEHWQPRTTPTVAAAPQGTGMIKGTVRAAATGSPLAGVRVNVLDVFNGTLLATTLTDATGAYTASGVGTATVSVRTSGTAGYLDVAYDGVYCEPNCSLYSGTLLSARDGATLEGIDFHLVAAATLSGTVTSRADAVPVAGVEIAVRRFGSDVMLAQAATAADGTYTVSELPPGQVQVLASSAQWADEVFADVPCEPSCGNMVGTPVMLSAGQNVGGVDFSLDRTGSISGRVRDAQTNVGVNASVLLCDALGISRAIAPTLADQDGEYSFVDLPAGTYYAGAETYDWRELYDELPWPDDLPPTAGSPIAVVGGQDTPGIDFTYSHESPPATAISGQIVAADTGLPLEGMVDVYNAAGHLVAYDYSSAAGYYLVAGLAPGEYFVKAGMPGYLPEVYDDVPCSPSCDPTTGTPVLVTADTQRDGIDFALSRGGWIAGSVTGADSGLPLVGVSVEVFNAAGHQIASVYTDDTGHYAVFGLGTGSYFVLAGDSYYSGSGYASQLYDGILCEDGCDVLSGTAVSVVAGLPANGIDFALTPWGDIAGTITDAATGAPVAGTTIYVQTGWWWWELLAASDAQGNYRVRRVPSGVAKVLAVDDRFRDELYDDIPCEAFSCSPSSGTPVSVTAGTTADHIDFALDPLGILEGRVTRADNGAPLPGVKVNLYRSGQGFYRYVSTDAAGYYRIFGLETGTYFAATEHSPTELVDELYDNVPCEPSCDPYSGTPIAVVAGQTRAGIDFSLETGGIIGGSVSDEQTGTPVANYTVIAYDATGTRVAKTQTAESGAFTLRGLPTGSFFVQASRGYSSSPYVGELYDDIPCDPSCTVTNGTPIAVTIGGTVTGIDFALKRVGSISGTVAKAGGGPLQGAFIQVYDPAGTVVGNAYADSLGAYSVAGVAPGTYFVKASAPGYAAELYDDLPCDTGCEVTAGAPVTVASAAVTPGVDFVLEARGGISGIVTEEPTGVPVANVRVNLYTQDGSWFRNTTSSLQGTYSFSDLPQGSYYLVASSLGHHDELYDNLPCETGCSPTSGTAVLVAVGAITSGVDFALAPRGAIAGTVRDNVTGAPIALQVWVFDASGNWVQSAYTDARGNYKVLGLEPGTYFVTTGPSTSWSPNEYLDELYNDILCEGGCSVTLGTPVAVAEGVTTSGIDFVLRRNGRITGRVTDATFGLPIGARYVRLYNTSGSYVAEVIPDQAGNFSSPYLPPGTYYVATQGFFSNDTWIDQLWEGRECEPSCDPTLGTPVMVAPDTVTTGIDFHLYEPFFADVPIGHWARAFIHSLYRHGITAGCGSNPLIYYCPTAVLNRAQNAVFLGVAGHGSGFAPPPPSGSIFADVPVDYWAATWIEQLWADGLTSGCAADPPLYCPELPLSRAEMAVFLLSAKHGPAYQPPPPSGTVFLDVPATHWAAAWIEQLAAEGITTGCATDLFCPDGLVDRAQMAVFLVTTFSLPY